MDGELQSLSTAELVARLFAIIDVIVERLQQGSQSSHQGPAAAGHSQPPVARDTEVLRRPVRCGFTCFFCDGRCEREEPMHKHHRCRTHNGRR